VAGFIHPPLTFHVWCKIESYPSPFRVQVCQNAQVYDVVEAAIEKGTHPGLVIVKFQGDSVMPGALISQYSTSDVSPLLLEVVEPEGKLHAVMYIMLQVLGEPCNLHFGCYGVEPGNTTKSIHTLQCSSWCSGLECLFASSLSFMVYLAEPSLIQATKAHRTFRRKDSMIH